MLNYTLTHPPLLRALAAAGHGSQVLLADGNYPAATAKPAGAEVIHLNLRPGLLSVTDVLGPLLEAVNVEAGRVMALPDGGAVPAHDEYRQLLGDAGRIRRDGAVRVLRGGPRARRRLRRRHRRPADLREPAPDHRRTVLMPRRP